MNIPACIGTVFLLCGLGYAGILIREFLQNREALRQAPGNFKLLLPAEFLVFFLCTLGVSDFLLNTLLIRKGKLSDAKGLPACLIVSTLVPGGFLSFSYLRAENTADTLTLILFMLFLVIGAAIGGRAANRMDGRTIRKILGIALLVSMAALVVKMIVSAGVTGTAAGFRGLRLVIMCVLCVGVGFLNMMGVPGKPITTAMLLLLGMSPVAALTLTIVLGSIIPMSSGFSLIKAGRYNRKLALAAMTAGSAAAVLGVMLAVSLDPLLLNILLLFVMLVAVISILKE